MPQDAIAPRTPRLANTYDSSYSPETWRLSTDAVAVAVPDRRLDAPQAAPDFHPHLPPGARSPVPPAIRLTTDNIPSAAYPPLPAEAHFSAAPSLDSYSPYPQYHPDHLTPPAQHYMAFEHHHQHQQPADAQMAVQAHVPVSPVSPHSGHDSRGRTPTAEPMSRKRSFSELSQHDPSRVMAHSPRDSNASNLEASPNGVHLEGYNPPQQRVSRTVKRSNPPVNDKLKYTCDFTPECAELTFDRKCEWR